MLGPGLRRLIFGGWSGVAKPSSSLFVRNGGVGQTEDPQEKGSFLFWSILDKSLSNVSPQMSLMMYVAVFNFFLF